VLGHALNAFIMIKLSEENSEKAEIEAARGSESDKRFVIDNIYIYVAIMYCTK
jgi:hypothetical protein